MAYNIIFYFSDQQRWDTCGCFGQPLNVTPNLDKLAEEGVKFDNAFSPQPVCGPCRALFQTGKYPTETGCFRNNLMLPSNIKTLPSASTVKVSMRRYSDAARPFKPIGFKNFPFLSNLTTKLL